MGCRYEYLWWTQVSLHRQAACMGSLPMQAIVMLMTTCDKPLYLP